MRCPPCAVFLLLSLAYPLSEAQTLPGPGPNNIKTLPGAWPNDVPTVSVHPQVAPTDEANRKRVLADLQELINESEALQKEVQSTTAGTLSAQSLKRAQQIENLSKKIRKTLKLN